MRRLLVASHNQGKLRELRKLLGDIRLEVISLDTFPGIQAVEETGDTFSENAALKAKGYARQAGLITLADDSGLEVEALGGRPGVFSARYAGDGSSDKARTDKLLAEMADFPAEERSARFCCSVAIADERGTIIHASNGVCEGKLALRPRGSAGFGYDPIFIPDGFEQTFAELNPEMKNTISHRARALQGAREFLRSLTISSDAG